MVVFKQPVFHRVGRAGGTSLVAVLEELFYLRNGEYKYAVIGGPARVGAIQGVALCLYIAGDNSSLFLRGKGCFVEFAVEPFA